MYNHKIIPMHAKTTSVLISTMIHTIVAVLVIVISEYSTKYMAKLRMIVNNRDIYIL